MVLRALKDRRKPPGSEPSQIELNKWQQALKSRVVAMEAVAKGRPKPKALAAGKTIPLLANAITARGFDRTLTMSLNRGLASFVETQHWQLLPEGCTRYFVSAADPDLPQHVFALGQTHRACIKDAQEATGLQNPTKARSELHTIADCGSSNLYRICGCTLVVACMVLTQLMLWHMMPITR